MATSPIGAENPSQLLAPYFQSSKDTYLWHYFAKNVFAKESFSRGYFAEVVKPANYNFQRVAVYNWQPLHVASICGNFEATKFFVSNLATLTAKDQFNHTPLYYWRMLHPENFQKQIVPFLKGLGLPPDPESFIQGYLGKRIQLRKESDCSGNLRPLCMHDSVMLESNQACRTFLWKVEDSEIYFSLLPLTYVGPISNKTPSIEDYFLSRCPLKLLEAACESEVLYTEYGPPDHLSELLDENQNYFQFGYSQNQLDELSKSTCSVSPLTKHLAINCGWMQFSPEFAFIRSICQNERKVLSLLDEETITICYLEERGLRRFISKSSFIEKEIEIIDAIQWGNLESLTQCFEEATSIVKEIVARKNATILPRILNSIESNQKAFFLINPFAYVGVTGLLHLLNEKGVQVNRINL